MKKNIHNFIKNIYGDWLYIKRMILFQINPKISINHLYRKSFKKKLNWENPKDLIEKIAWMEFNTDTSLWSKCADKLLVRDYVTECGCSYILNENYGHWNSADEIDFDKLPQSFVLKSNNGCGAVLVVNDKNLLNIKSAKKTLNKWLKRKVGLSNGQLHYQSIKPCIIADKILISDSYSNFISPSSLIDYKVFCINGEPESILVVYNRNIVGHSLLLYDLQWNKISENLFRNNHWTFRDINMEKPVCLDEILQLSRILSKPFKEVRVDFYIIDNKPIFGELTFSPGYGNLTKEYYDFLGAKIDLSDCEKLK